MVYLFFGNVTVKAGFHASDGMRVFTHLKLIYFYF